MNPVMRSEAGACNHGNYVHVPFRNVIVYRDQLEYTAPTGFRFLDEPMFCFSTDSKC